jgi:hypothetical protein
MSALYLHGPMLALLLAAAPFGARPDPLSELRRDYLSAVSDQRAIGRGLDEVARLRAGNPPGAPAPLDATLAAYEGALITLRAKHASWPPAKLRHLRQGLGVLDSLVARYPAHVEARWLRLMSCYSLPAVLGRKRSVQEDVAALARTLPAAQADLPPEQYRAMAAFLLQTGALPPEERRGLESSLRADR